MTTTAAMHMDARMSECGRYRYTLTRLWDPVLPSMTLVMLNPSTADAFKNDPTATRGVGFARDLGHGGLDILNAYAFKATKPTDLWLADDPVGPENDDHLRKAFSNAREGGGLVIAAWGVHAKPLRVHAVVRLAGEAGVQLHALAVTKSGAPGHPLYLPATAQPRPWPVRKEA